MEDQKHIRTVLNQLQARNDAANARINKYIKELEKLKRASVAEFCRLNVKSLENVVISMDTKEKELIDSNNKLKGRITKLNHEIDSLTQHFRRLQAINFPKVSLIFCCVLSLHNSNITECIHKQFDIYNIRTM